MGIVVQSGGHIWAYSEPGVGSTFKIYLPRIDAEIDAAAERAVQPVLRGNETILLVEDEEAVRTVVRTVLRRNGYVVIEAQNGPEALRQSEQFAGAIHLLLTDVIMPRMNGREVANQLAIHRPDTRVLYVSGYTEVAIVQHGVLDPGIAFLPKPITPSALLRRVREVLDAP